MIKITMAARDNDMEGIRQALRNGEDVNARDTNGSSALHWAATFTSSLGAMKLLLEAGADIHARDNFQSTPLHDAAHGDNMAAAKMLLSAGAHLGVEDRCRNRPVACAIRELADYLQSVENGKTSRPTAKETGLDMDKRLDILDPGGSKFRKMEAARQAQRRAALERGEGI